MKPRTLDVRYQLLPAWHQIPRLRQRIFQTTNHLSLQISRVKMCDQHRKLCEVCFKYFTTVGSLNRHIREKHDENPLGYECPECYYFTTRKCFFQLHLQRHGWRKNENNKKRQKRKNTDATQDYQSPRKNFNSDILSTAVRQAIGDMVFPSMENCLSPSDVRHL